MTSTNPENTKVQQKVDTDFMNFLKAITVTILSHVRCNDLTLEYCIAKLDVYKDSNYDDLMHHWVTVIINLTVNLPNLSPKTLELIFLLSKDLYLDAHHTPAIKHYPDFLRTFINTQDFDTQVALKEGFYKKAVSLCHPASPTSTAASATPCPLENSLEKLDPQLHHTIIELENKNNALFEQNQKLELKIKETTILLQLAESEINKLRHKTFFIENKENIKKAPVRLRDQIKGINPELEESNHDVYQEVLRQNNENEESIDERIFRREQDEARLSTLATEPPNDFAAEEVKVAIEAASTELMKAWGETLGFAQQDLRDQSILDTIYTLKNEKRINHNCPYFAYLSHVHVKRRTSPFAYNIPWEDIRSEIIAELIKVITDSNFKIKGNINDSVVFDASKRVLEIKYGVGEHEHKDRIIRLFEVNRGVGLDFNNKLVKNENIKVFMLCARACNKVLNADLLSQDPYGEKGNVIILSGPAKGKAEIGAICKMILGAQASNLKPVIISDYYDEQENSDIRETLAQNEFLTKYRAMFGYPELAFLKLEKKFRASHFS